MKPTAKPAAAESPAKQIAGFLAKFDPAMAKLITSARQALRKRFPTAVELVYDNYNFLVFGFCATERASDCHPLLDSQRQGNRPVFPLWQGLARSGIRSCMGSGNQTRFIRLGECKDPGQTRSRGADPRSHRAGEDPAA